MKGYWTCRRRVDGRLCRRVNPNIKRKCQECGGPKPKKRRPNHMRALDLPREVYLALNDGIESCAICGRPQTDFAKALHRDHDHATGKPRGLLCFPCNKKLRHDVTAEWLRAAADYLDRGKAAA